MAVMTNLQSCLSFALDRTAVHIPVMWNVPVSVQSERKMSIESATNNKAQPVDANKVEEFSEPKKMAEYVNFPVLTQDKRSKTVLQEMSKVAEHIHNVDEPTIATLKEDTSKSVYDSAPRNVVLLLVDGVGKSGRDVWKDFKPGSFPVESFLQACQNNTLDKPPFFLDDELTSGDEDRKCDCEHILRLNVASLLSWARNTRNMATGAILATNFTIPSPPTYVESMDETKESEEFDMNNWKQEVRNEEPKVREDWRVIDLDVTPAHSTTILKSSGKQKEITQNGETWDMLDLLSRMRLLFFRTLVESLGRRMDNPRPELFARKARSPRSGLVELVSNTIRELNSLAKEKGYVVAVVVPGNELTSIVELLQNQITEKDTLLVITEICSHESKPVRFFARGPAAKDLYDAKGVWDLPKMLGELLVNRCHSTDCEIRRTSKFPFGPLRILRRDLTHLRRVTRNSDDGMKSLIDTAPIAEGLGYAQPTQHGDTATTSASPDCTIRQQPTGGGV
ncbi:hypothetical protein KM043_013414 [Ampulex compressa]|nr:hypothetical protein KM043_013414 [Ampulex compressa]